MRIHGKFKIKRREIKISHWEKHKTQVEEDFFGICGYCGNHLKATYCQSQIDHFVPQKKYPEYKNKYSNLVFSCKVCNNKKRDDWPSGDPSKNITDDGKKGYIDPASDEYDANLERCNDGNIVGISEVGKYMANRLGFNYRPISEIHKIGELYEAIQNLRSKREQGDLDYDSELLNELFITCEDLRNQIHMEKE